MTIVDLIGVILTLWALWAFVRMATRSRSTMAGSSAVTLQNEDRIVCTIALEIQLTDLHLSATAIPFYPDQRDSIKAEAEVLKEAAVNRWAFQFESAIDARKKSSYDSLTKALESGIVSPRFTVKASVTNIQIAYQFKAPPEPEPEPTDRDEAIAQLESKKALFAATAQWRKDNPELVADPEFEPVIDPIRKRFRDSNGLTWNHRKRPYGRK